MMTVKKPDNSDDATDEDYINDKTDEEKKIMRSKENELIAL